MEYAQIRKWEQALETSELSPITANLPKEARVGERFIEPGNDGITREWIRVEIVAGNPSARWAYWLAWMNKNQPGQGPHPEFKVVADLIFNGDASHFVGMLGLPYSGKIAGASPFAWVLVSPRVEGGRLQTIFEEKRGERYERSNEEFDVNTQESRKIR